MGFKGGLGGRTVRTTADKRGSCYNFNFFKGFFVNFGGCIFFELWFVLTFNYRLFEKYHVSNSAIIFPLPIFLCTCNPWQTTRNQDNKNILRLLNSLNFPF